MVELLVAVGSLLFGATGLAWWRSPVARARRRTGKAVRRVGRLAAELDGRLESRQAQLREQGGRFVEAQHAARLAALPVETLKDSGARNVRWAPVREAGITSVADARRASTVALVRLRGVGMTSAKRIHAAAESAEQAERARPVPPPRPDLDEPHAEPLVAAGHGVLVARDLVADVPERLASARQPLESAWPPLRRRCGPLSWLGRRVSGGSDEGLLTEADQLQRTADDIAEGELGQRARAALQGLDEPAEPPSGGALATTYRHRFAEFAAVFDAVLGGDDPVLSLPDRKSGARLPDEIVARVEGLALKTDELSVLLRRYQDFGERYLVVQERTILGDDMGLGKTVQALAAMAHLWTAEQARHFLVVAPATVVLNWGREVQRHTRLPAHLLYGDDRDAARERWLEEGGVAITSYSTARRLGLVATLSRRRLPLDMLVADEAHYLKNPEAARTVAVADVLQLSKRACLMTGTPLENRLDEFLNLLRMVQPDLPAAAADPDAIEPAAFQHQIARAYLRRNQTDVLHELPARIDKDEWVELDAPGARAYAEAVASGNIMAMRRCATVGSWPGPSAPSGKLARLAELVAEHAASGRKVLVFSFFRDVLSAVSEQLDVFGVIHGDVSVPERESLMDAFREHPGHAVLVGQIRAAGVGLNLQAASVVVLMEPQWKPSTEEQAIARAHRMGQSESVVVHRLLARDCVDERMLELLAGKQQVFAAFATPSLIKDASHQATEASLARLVVETEQARLAAAGSPQA